MEESIKVAFHHAALAALIVETPRGDQMNIMGFKDLVNEKYTEIKTERRLLAGNANMQMCDAT